jgi:hypothetical protein
MFEEDFELREKVFKKMGWTQESTDTHTSFWWTDHEMNEHEEILPPIETTWEVCAKYLVPYMRGKCWSWSKQNSFSNACFPYMGGSKEWFVWRELKNPIKAEIINDNIARAACEAFLEVNDES